MNLALVRRRAAHHARKQRAKLVSEVRRARALDQMKQAAAKVLLEGEPDRAIFKGGTMKLTMAIRGFEVSEDYYDAVAAALPAAGTYP